MKNPFELIREIELNNLEQKIKNFELNIQNIEKFILWIVGFSVGGIALIISNIDKLKNNFDDCTLKKALVFFIISVLFGILNRYAIHKLQVYSQITDIFLRVSLSNYDFPELVPEELNKNDDFYKIIDRFKIDFNLDYSRYIKEFENLTNPDQKLKTIKELRERHKEISKFAQETFLEGQENVRRIYKEAYGFSDKRSENIYYYPQFKVAKKFNLWKYFVDLTFIFCCLTFLIGILILVIKF